MITTHLSLLVLLHPSLEAAKLNSYYQRDKYTEEGGKDDTIEIDNKELFEDITQQDKNIIQVVSYIYILKYKAKIYFCSA